MIRSKLSYLTSFMIYGGTFLLSILSFFTTYYGLMIVLDKPLALMGSLGLQIAMLGIAWNLIKIREHRASYVAVFLITAAFSMFFSYVNFDSSLKANTRVSESRRAYANAARPILNQYAQSIRKSVIKGKYQVDRIGALIDIEEQKGWATVVDEGSQDEYIQSVIEGARIMVDSWRQNQGADYRQGQGRGIIAEYLQSRRDQTADFLQIAQNYLALVDSIALNLNGDEPVATQYRLINQASVEFPTSVYQALTSETAILLSPPNQADYPEQPLNRQQALLLVINDLFVCDQLTLFSILLAVAVDLIVILMALAGSYALDDDEHVFNRVRQEAVRRVRELPLNDNDEFVNALRANLDQFEKASEYGLELHKVLDDYKYKKNGPRVTMKRPGEAETETSAPTAKRKIVI